jgi:putative ABC transport system permease protein
MQQKLRASLASLGIFIGTTTVIWLVAMGEGVSHQAQQQIKDLGATNIIVRSVKPPTDYKDRTSPIVRYGLLREDYKRIISNIPTVTRAIPMREIHRKMQVGDRATDVRLVGCTTDYFELNRLSIRRGRPLRERDDGDNVIVLADKTAQELFPYEDPRGRTVRMGNEIYVVVGQTHPRVASAAIGGSLEARDYSLDAYIPLATLEKRIGDMVISRRSGSFGGEIVELSQITLSVASMEEVDATATVVETLLKKFHETTDYAVVIPKELLNQAERTRAMFNALLVVIAGISLAVGGIGIMNIMLATVTERTREIGIRRALGARRQHIIQQFLSETIVLTTSGGLLGVVFGLMCGPIFRTGRAFLTAMWPDSLPAVVQTLEPRIAPWSVVLSVVISVGVGVLFGVYPARQAAHMDPIEALRHE